MSSKRSTRMLRGREREGRGEKWMAGQAQACEQDKTFLSKERFGMGGLHCRTFPRRQRDDVSKRSTLVATKAARAGAIPRTARRVTAGPCSADMVVAQAALRWRRAASVGVAGA